MKNILTGKSSGDHQPKNRKEEKTLARGTRSKTWHNNNTENKYALLYLSTKNKYIIFSGVKGLLHPLTPGFSVYH
jgi:hypothetical protein